jgi:acetyl-CoA carboxylase biotin carboxyl carrier protein
MPTDDSDSDSPSENLNGAVPHIPQEQSLVSRVKALAEALEGSDISELDLMEGGARVVIRRQLEPTMVVPRAGNLPIRRPGGMPARARGEEAAAPSPAVEPGVAVISPLTGMFYTASSPSSPPFAQVGDTVQAGQVVCIVEAMKVFNEIKSEISGTVASLVAENGQLVQKGQPLLRIKPI